MAWYLAILARFRLVWLESDKVLPKFGDGGRKLLDFDRNFQILALTGFQLVPESGLSEAGDGCRISTMVDCLNVKVNCIV
jgi:hypothetical protein